MDTTISPTRNNKETFFKFLRQHATKLPEIKLAVASATVTMIFGAGYAYGAHILGAQHATFAQNAIMTGIETVFITGICATGIFLSTAHEKFKESQP